MLSRFTLPVVCLGALLVPGALAAGAYSLDDIVDASGRELPERVLLQMAGVSAESISVDSDLSVRLLRAGLSQRVIHTLSDGEHPTQEEVAAASEDGPSYRLPPARLIPPPRPPPSPVERRPLPTEFRQLVDHDIGQRWNDRQAVPLVEGTADFDLGPLSGSVRISKDRLGRTTTFIVSLEAVNRGEYDLLLRPGATLLLFEQRPTGEILQVTPLTVSRVLADADIMHRYLVQDAYLRAFHSTTYTSTVTTSTAEAAVGAATAWSDAGGQIDTEQIDLSVRATTTTTATTTSQPPERVSFFESEKARLSAEHEARVTRIRTRNLGVSVLPPTATVDADAYFRANVKRGSLYSFVIAYDGKRIDVVF